MTRSPKRPKLSQAAPSKIRRIDLLCLCVIAISLLTTGVAYWQLNERQAPTPESPHKTAPTPTVRTLTAEHAQATPVAKLELDFVAVHTAAEATRPLYYVWGQSWNPKLQRFDTYKTGMSGTEPTHHSAIRGHFVSENQQDYPQPEGGCGPTALLNLYIWYKKFGLLPEPQAHADPRRYKLLKFEQIDRSIRRIQGDPALREEGTNSLEQMIALDEIVRTESAGQLRIHAEFKSPPLQTQDFLALNRHYRAGILSLQIKDPKSLAMLGYHAALVVRCDRTGKITLANWGGFSHGRLVKRNAQQWFVPDDTEQHEFLVLQLTSIIPFIPDSAPGS